jgi:predicted peptidase
MLRQIPKEVPSEVRIFKTLRYRLFKPLNFDATQTYPLVLSLHGGGPRHKFEHLLEGDTPGFAYGLGRLVSAETQSQHPCFVFAPWSGEQGWDEANRGLVLGALRALQAEFKIDAKRIYVAGQSMGGYGTWAMVTEHPDVFAAAIPICGGGDPEMARRAKAVPIWAFHGTADTLVPVSETRRMVRALLEAGGNITYWEYQGATHAQTAERAYGEPNLINWLFQQAKP